VLGLERYEQLQGQLCRLQIKDALIHSMGHIMEDNGWFDFHQGLIITAATSQESDDDLAGPRRVAEAKTI